MKNIIFVDTNFLISNIGNIKNIIKEFEEEQYEIYITQTVKNEFINIQLRKLKETYSKLENLKNSYEILDIKYKEETKAIKTLEYKYNQLFEKNFANKIIGYDDSAMLKRVLERNRYKMPPFYNEPNSTDKGFKDTIILLTIKDFISKYDEDAKFYIITADNGFIKYKYDIETEINNDTKKIVNIIDGKNKENVYKQLNIVREEKKEEKENIFNKLEEIDINKIRENINELMFQFNYEIVGDFWGNSNPEKRYELYEELNYEDTEYLLNNIHSVIEKNIFNKEISISEIFKNENDINSQYSIDISILKNIYDIYMQIDHTEYKDAFINFVMKSINANKVDKRFTIQNDDDLPF